MKLIDPSKNQVPIWLVWSLTENGTILNAICLERIRANGYRKVIRNNPGIIKAWVEQVESNHLYGSMFEIPNRESIDRLIAQRLAGSTPAAHQAQDAKVVSGLAE